MEKYIILVKSGDDVHTTAGIVQGMVNKCLEEGYDLAGGLIHYFRVSESSLFQWHTFVQPMILREDIDNG